MQALIILLTLAIQDCSYYLCFIFFYIFSSSDLVSKDKTFNTRQEKEPLVVDPLGLFRVLPHSPAKKVVCMIVFLHFEYFWYHLCPQDTSSQTQATQQQWPERPPLPQRCPPSYTTRVKFCHEHFISPTQYEQWAFIYVCAKAHRKPQLQTQTQGGTVCGTDWHLGRFRRLRRWILCHWDRHLWCQVFLLPILIIVLWRVVLVDLSYNICFCSK